MNFPAKKPFLVRTIIDYLSFTWVPEDVAAFRKIVRLSVENDVAGCIAEWAPDWWDRSKPLTDPSVQAPLLERARKSWIENEIKRRYDGQFALDFNKLDLSLTREMLTFFDQVSPMFGDTTDIIERDRGVFGYKRSWQIMVDGVQVGIAASGAKNGGCFVSITGQGCGYFDMPTVHSFLVRLPSIKLTRTDIAFDDFNGVNSVKRCRDQYKAGEFICSGRAPSYRYIEGGHLDMDRKVKGQNPLVPSDGCSFYVGKRENGKMLRCYEKGKQLMGQGRIVDPDRLNWVRWELELRNDNRVLPLDILLKPSEYLAMSYPALAFIAEEGTPDETCRIATTQKTVKISYSLLRHYAKTGYGALVNVMRNSMGMSDSQIVKALISTNDGAVPRRLKKAMGGVIYATG